jgi:hypothetical protein
MSDDTADDGLIDVSGISLQEVLDNVDEPSFTSALDRIFAQQDGGCYGFNSSI